MTLNLIAAMLQVEAMAAKVAGDARNAALEAFKSKYGVVFTRETFTLERPTADDTFVLSPDNEDPLPPIGGYIRVHGYNGESWHTVVVGVDPATYSYTAQIVKVEL